MTVEDLRCRILRTVVVVVKYEVFLESLTFINLTSLVRSPLVFDFEFFYDLFYSSKIWIHVHQKYSKVQLYVISDVPLVMLSTVKTKCCLISRLSEHSRGPELCMNTEHHIIN